MTQAFRPNTEDARDRLLLFNINTPRQSLPLGGVSLLHQGGQNNFFHTNMFSLMFARTHTHTHTHTKRISHDGTSLDEVQHQLLHYNVVARSIHLKKIVLPSAEVSVFFCVLRKRPQPALVRLLAECWPRSWDVLKNVEYPFAVCNTYIRLQL